MAAVSIAVAISVAVLIPALGGGSDALEKPTAPSAEVAPGITVSPQPSTRDAFPQTEISFLGKAASTLGKVSVVGSQSGSHSGRLASYSSARGASFVPDTAFTPGETVTVRAPTAGIRYSFSVVVPATLPGGNAPAPAVPAAGAESGSGAWSFVSRPDLHPTTLSVTKWSAAAKPGYVFVAPIQQPNTTTAILGQYGPLIFDKRGNPVWEHPVPAGLEAMNLRPQTYHGKPVLTWWQGQLSALGYGEGDDYIVDNSYRTIGVVHGGNGYRADVHEFTLLSNGAALVTGYAPVNADLTPVGGPKNGIVIDTVIQEIDVKTGRVMFQWDPLSHLSIKDSYQQPSGTDPRDGFHTNSVDVDAHGDLLVSVRNTWSVYLVDHRTGEIKWRLGGKQSDFGFDSGARFAWQHDVRFGPDGTVSVFDNEGAPASGKQSRALALSLDTGGHSASLVRERTHHGSPLMVPTQGNAQPLADGGMFVGWGAAPYVSEYSKSGDVVFEARFQNPDESYRAYSSQWSGRPAEPPAIAVTRSGSGSSATVYASWNGATGVASWEVLGGSSPADLKPLGSVPRQGFETAMNVASTAPYFAVRALDSHGRTLATSSAEKG